MGYWFIVHTDSMKKSEKLKGKTAVSNRKKMQVRYGILAGAAVLIVVIFGFIVFNPVVAKTGDTVKVYYTGTLDDGTVFDSNENTSPLEFTLGEGTVIPGFEEAVTGMAVNESKTVWVPSEKAYGSYNSSFIYVLNRSAFPVNMTPVTGQYYNIRSTTDGSVRTVKVINVTASTITLDGNHALAGQNLTFSIRLAGINKK